MAITGIRRSLATKNDRFVVPGKLNTRALNHFSFSRLHLSESAKNMYVKVSLNARETLDLKGGPYFQLSELMPHVQSFQDQHIMTPAKEAIRSLTLTKNLGGLLFTVSSILGVIGYSSNKASFLGAAATGLLIGTGVFVDKALSSKALHSAVKFYDHLMEISEQAKGEQAILKS